ncbi:YicC family protein [Clostridiaceae bacterium 68-1-5]|uniref:YicC family protein n=1 Tax=Suipraeoptans intestinalis TaxID=2606628 RepID=A0A6N7UU16_9FIRM|nr:YicC/YloC family endoribonuclease [Suipraeoptans intestinalis]MSR94824.1 YicC family protein [Suipraeoptans intestinalis]
MIKSMTGFGRSETESGEQRFTVEMKSVNHRYLDISIRVPRKLNFLETAAKSYLKQKIQRGKVDVFIGYEDLSQRSASIKYNREAAGEYLHYLRQMAEEFGLEQDVRTSVLSRYPEVFTMEEQSADEDTLWEGMKAALDQAAKQFVGSRIREGEQLEKDICEKLDGMRKLVLQIEERAPQILAEYRRRIEEKAAELLENAQIEESRLAAEMVLFADKICTDEEIVRLKSHIQSMQDTLGQMEEGVGRKLDFIAQEMNREANTILSKSNDLETSNLGIQLKTEIEKVREQIQNVE